MSMIPSACFSVSAGANGHYTLSGGGFGHGIGFSQYGGETSWQRQEAAIRI